MIINRVYGTGNKSFYDVTTIANNHVGVIDLQ